MSPSPRLLLILLTAGLLTQSPAEDWSRFRGPNGSGIATGKGYPVTLDANSNLLWRTPVLPGKSSPVLTSDRVYLTGHDGDDLIVQAFDRETGRLLWQRSLSRERHDPTHALNDPAAPSPVTDGENVYAFFQDFGLVSYSKTGEPRWTTPLGPFQNMAGMGGSPILAGGRLVLQADHSAGSYIAAFDTRNGEFLWKQARSEIDSYSTPVVHRGQILTVADRTFGSYEIASGKRTVTELGMALAVVASPVLAGDTIFGFGYNVDGFTFAYATEQADADKNGVIEPAEHANDSFLRVLATERGNKDGVLTKAEYDEFMANNSGPSNLAAMQLEIDDTGKIVGAHRLWSYERSFAGVIPSPLIYEGVLYYLKNGGILTTIDPKTGDLLHQGRVREAAEGYSASPVAADGRLYLASEEGKIAVLRAGAEWQVLAVSDLGEPIYATPALSAGTIYVRTDAHVYAFGH